MDRCAFYVTCACFNLLTGSDLAAKIESDFVANREAGVNGDVVAIVAGDRDVLVNIAHSRKIHEFKSVPNHASWLADAIERQRSSRRDTLAMHAKIDELLRSDHKARSELATLDEEEPETIARHRDEEMQTMRRPV